MASERKLLEGAEQHMEPGEQIVSNVPGTYETKIMGTDSVRSGLLIATDRRVVFYAKKLTGYDIESFPYTSISSIDQGKNMMGHKVTFYASGNKVDVKWITDLEKLQRFMDSAKSHIHARTAAKPALQPPPTPTEAPDVMAQIRSLGELRDAGVLTDQEFAAKKAELLGRI
ncbi:MAG: PH domain-containing protein [Actinomycetota bacterium]|nr:PH domain-containing protein [Actinomycetota bacterium]